MAARCFACAPWPPIFAVSAAGLVLSLAAMGWPLRHLGATLHHAHEQAGTAFLLRDWALMLLAMMPPLVAAPLMHITVSSLPHRRSRAIAVFASGYATVWLAAGPVLFMMSALLQSLTGGAAFAAAMLIAIVWAISPWQQLALNRCCRLRRIGLFGLDADRDCVTFGLLHGLWCIAACWAWMLLPLTAGAAHVPVMTAAGLIMFRQRLGQPRVPRWRLAMLFSPGTQRAGQNLVQR